MESLLKKTPSKVNQVQVAEWGVGGRLFVLFVSVFLSYANSALKKKE